MPASYFVASLRSYILFNTYTGGFKLLQSIGLKKTSVRLARNLEKRCREPLEESVLYEAIWYFNLHVTSFTLCQGFSGCYFPILSDDDPFHQYCREAEAAEKVRVDAEKQADQADWEDYLRGQPQDDDQEDDGCPHCGSRSCNTWDCQQ